ncbi:cysteine hydrolase family protein [Brevundimonas diminuta]|uniref:cysteine hydrolase family protein n=1 Tax=Brevundimonas diminuta TaxID=293 RepID=UPI003D9A89D4
MSAASRPTRSICAWTCKGCSPRTRRGAPRGCPASCRWSCACASTRPSAPASPASSPRSPGDGLGAWRRYWERWASITLANLGEERVDLLTELQAFTPPARVLDKAHYSPWLDTGLATALMTGQVDTLVVTGAETDMCVLATVLGAVDLGFRVVVVSDALCSSSDQSHDALLDLYHDRFGQQIETAECDEVLEAWA